MTVYGEVLFTENFITGLMILMLTGKLRGYQPEKWRLITGAVMCGIYAFVLLVPLHWLTALGTKLLFSAVTVVLVFGRATLRGIIKTAAVFYIVSFLMGGVTIAIMYMLKIPGMAGNGSYVLKGASFLQIAAGVAVTWYLGCRLAGLMREKVMKQQVLRRVTVQISGKEWELNALVDTGNSLKEPVTGFPVAVLSKNMSEKIQRECDSEQMIKVVAIPYRTVGRSSIMFGLKPDFAMIDGKVTTDIILGFGERNFSPWRGDEKYELLLHQQFLEGEENDYGEKCDDGRRSRGIRRAQDQ